MNLIKNMINIENLITFNKKQKTATQENKFLELTYTVITKLNLNKENLPQINPNTFDIEVYENLFKNIGSLLDKSLWESIYVDKIIIKNTGTKSIKLTDFYNNDRLGFRNSKTIIAASIDKKITKKYINAQINITNLEQVKISFDEIEVGDQIEIYVLSREGMKYIELSGKTKDFDAPKKYNKSNDNNEETIKSAIPIFKTAGFLLFIKLLICIFMFSILTLDLYLKHNNKNLYVRNPFVLLEVENAKN